MLALHATGAIRNSGKLRLLLLLLACLPLLLLTPPCPIPHTHRPRQLEVIQNVLYGRDCVALMATGMGKSLTYQMPSLALREMSGYRCVTVVISPLISLMEDQVVGLRSNGARAWHPSIHSSTPLFRFDRRFRFRFD